MPESAPYSPLLPTPARKTSPPDQKSLIVRRPRLIDRLQRDGRNHTLIEGAAGAGKTVLAAQWANEIGKPIAWVTLDATDNDPVVLISSVMDSLHRAGLAGAWDAGPLTSDEPTYSRSVVPHFQICLASQSVPFTLVLDDAHELTHQRVTWLLRCALESLPPGSHGILAGRALTTLPVAQWISSEQALLVTESELAMSTREVKELVAGLRGTAPDMAMVSNLVQATHGWPIAVYLGSRVTAPATLGNLTYVSAFLDQEVLRDADPDTVALLQATAGLLDLSADLCDFVLEQNRSAQLLERAERSSLLVTRSQDHDWFRLHPLLREHLQSRLEQEDPEHYRTVALRASQWSLRQGHIDRAITYARDSGDPEQLGVTIWEGASQALTTGQAQRVVDWLAAVDDSTIAQTCPIALAAAWCAVYRGRPADAHRWSQAAFGTAYDGWENNLDRSSMEAGLALLLSMAGSLGYHASAELAGRAMHSLPSEHVVVPFAQMLAGWMNTLDGASDIGIEDLRGSAQLAQSRGLLGTEVEAKALLATALLATGDDKRAQRLVHEALMTWEQGGIKHFLATGAMIAGPAALLAARTGQRREAAALLAQVEESKTMFGPVMPWLISIAESFATAAHSLLGDQESAGRHLEAAIDATDRLPPSPLLSSLLGIARSTVDREFALSDLTPAERRVFERLLTRATLREIAALLFVSPETVKTQTGSIYRKLGISSRRELQEMGERLRM